MTQRAIDGDYFYFVTTLVKNREWFFIYPDRADRLSQVIKNACTMKKFDLFAYCILPNHIHVLVRKTDSTNEQTQRALEKTRCGNEDSGLQGNITDLSTQQLQSPTTQSGLSSPRKKTYTLSQLMQSIKGNYSWQITDEGLWHPRFNFRIIETDRRLENTVNYIIHNYKKMALDETFGKPPFVFVDFDRISGLL